MRRRHPDARIRWEAISGYVLGAITFALLMAVIFNH